MENTFRPYGAAHLVAIALIFATPFVLAALVRLTGSNIVERIVAAAVTLLLVATYIGYVLLVRRSGELTFSQVLPMQMCDWAIAVVIIAMWTGRRGWFEVAYFWGIGGTLQAVLTPNLRYGFPDFRFFSFFISHGGVIVGVVFLMLTRRLRPYPMSIVRAFLWSEFYFVVALIVDHLTGVNYGFLLHKPESAQTLLNYLADDRALYLFQMHLLALVFFAVLYAPFAIYDVGRSLRNAGKQEGIG